MLERTAAAGARPRRPSPFAWFEDLGLRRYAHTRGGATALFRSPPGGGPGREHRLLVADGALPAIAAAACGRRWSRTRYAGVGGVWTGAAALAD